jgi:hypothetical protein
MSQNRVVPTGHIVIQSQFHLRQLTGVAVHRRGDALGQPDLPVGRVLNSTVPRANLICRCADAAEVIEEDPLQCVSVVDQGAYGYGQRAGKVELLHPGAVGAHLFVEWAVGVMRGCIGHNTFDHISPYASLLGCCATVTVVEIPGVLQRFRRVFCWNGNDYRRGAGGLCPGSGRLWGGRCRNSFRPGCRGSLRGGNRPRTCGCGICEHFKRIYIY